MKRFEIGRELSLLAVDAALELDTIADGSCLSAANELGQRISELEKRLFVPYSDVEASVGMRNVFNEMGIQVDTIEELRRCLRDIAFSLTGSLEAVRAKKQGLLSFCIAMSKLSRRSHGVQ